MLPLSAAGAPGQNPLEGTQGARSGNVLRSQDCVRSDPPGTQTSGLKSLRRFRDVARPKSSHKNQMYSCSSERGGNEIWKRCRVFRIIPRNTRYHNRTQQKTCRSSPEKTLEADIKGGLLHTETERTTQKLQQMDVNAEKRDRVAALNQKGLQREVGHLRCGGPVCPWIPGSSCRRLVFQTMRVKADWCLILSRNSG